MNNSLCAFDEIFHDYQTLKKLRRTGWQLRGIRDGESIADHCFGVVLLTFLLSDSVETPRLNRDRAVAIATVHELGECRVGDIPYTALKYFPNKSEAEQNSVIEMTAGLGEIGTLCQNLLKEFEDGSSTEARFVRAIDRLDMLITALEYKKAGFTGLKDFWENEKTFETMKEFPQIYQYAIGLREKNNNPSIA